MKCVMVIDRQLPLGLIANAAAVLAVTIGRKVDDIVGEDAADGDGTIHLGITRATIPLLSGDGPSIRELRKKLLNGQGDGLFFVDFCDVAQRCKDYADYLDQLSRTPEDELNYLGIAIYGPNKSVDKLTGSLALLR